MIRWTGGWLIAPALMTCLSTTTRAQSATTPPFIGGPLTVFDIETAIIDSAALLDAKVYVSEHDRKYVTYGGNNFSTAGLALQEVQDRKTLVHVGHLGYVGGILPAGKKPAGLTLPLKASAAPPRLAQDGESNDNPRSMFDRRGVFLLSPLK